MNIAHVGIEGRRAAPNWAIGQRHLIGAMNRAAHSFVRHATREDGSLKQRSVWTSMDGTDNGYEAFMSFPLFYLVGGDDHIRTTARREWEAITAQYEGYGTVDRGFVTGFDWFHHSESYPYIYYLSMSEPGRADDLDPRRETGKPGPVQPDRLWVRIDRRCEGKPHPTGSEHRLPPRRFPREHSL